MSKRRSAEEEDNGETKDEKSTKRQRQLLDDEEVGNGEPPFGEEETGEMEESTLTEENNVAKHEEEEDKETKTKDDLSLTRLTPVRLGNGPKDEAFEVQWIKLLPSLPDVHLIAACDLVMQQYTQQLAVNGDCVWLDPIDLDEEPEKRAEYVKLLLTDPRYINVLLPNAHLSSDRSGLINMIQQLVCAGISWCSAFLMNEYRGTSWRSLLERLTVVQESHKTFYNDWSGTYAIPSTGQDWLLQALPDIRRRFRPVNALGPIERICQLALAAPHSVHEALSSYLKWRFDDKQLCEWNAQMLQGVLGDPCYAIISCQKLFTLYRLTGFSVVATKRTAGEDATVPPYKVIGSWRTSVTGSSLGSSLGTTVDVISVLPKLPCGCTDCSMHLNEVFIAWLLTWLKVGATLYSTTSMDVVFDGDPWQWNPLKLTSIKQNGQSVTLSAATKQWALELAPTTPVRGMIRNSGLLPFNVCFREKNSNSRTCTFLLPSSFGPAYVVSEVTRWLTQGFIGDPTKLLALPKVLNLMVLEYVSE